MQLFGYNKEQQQEQKKKKKETQTCYGTKRLRIKETRVRITAVISYAGAHGVRAVG